jgi:uncharacterized protein (TIGR02285 family)
MFSTPLAISETRLSSKGNFLSLLLMLLFGFCSPSPSAAQVKDTILWLNPDFPPVYIIDGPQIGQGVGDKVQTYFQKLLPQYQHENRLSNFKRIIATLAAGKKACAITLLKNKEREKVVLYSHAFMIAPPNEIITVKRLLPDFAPFTDSQGAVSLVEVLNGSSLKLGYSPGRSYFSAIDKIIKTQTSDRNSLSNSGVDIFEGLMNMLKRGRIDYTIGYGYEARYIARSFGFGEEVIAIPVSEHRTYIRVYAGCPKTDWGKKVITELNTLFQSARHEPEVYGVYREWLDPHSWQRYINALPSTLWNHTPER